MGDYKLIKTKHVFVVVFFLIVTIKMWLNDCEVSNDENKKC